MRKIALVAPLFPFASFASFAFLFALATTSSAQSTSAASQQLFQDGTKLLKDGKVHEACLKFGESQRLEPELGTLLNLAACHEKEGKVATAWTEYTELVDVSAKKGDAKRGAYAKKIAELEPTLPRLQLDVPAGTSELTLDGAALGPAAWSTVLPMDPGEHVIAYGAPSKKSANVRVTLIKSQTTKTTPLPLENGAEPTPPLPPPTPPIASAAPPPPAPSSSSTPPPSTPPPVVEQGSGLRTAGYVVGGVGVIGLGLGTVFGIVALSDKSTVTNNCVGTQCSQAGLNAVDSARRDSAISTTGFIAGGVCLAAGAAMIYLGRKKAPQVGVVPYANEAGGGIVGFGSF